MEEKIETSPMLEATLSACINGRIGHPVHAFQCVGSTMEIAHALAQEGAPEGTLVWAVRQEQGRGRLGRLWTSPEGGAYFSLILCPQRPAAEHPQLSLVAGLSTAQAIQELTGLFPAIRWPNDVLIDNKKVAGILIESRVSDYVVIGIGINVTIDRGELPEGATSLAASSSPAPDPCRLTGVLCRHLETWYDAWTSKGFAPIREALRPWMGHFGQPVHITAGSHRFEGTASDLDECGRLLVRLDSGLIRPFEVGEVTLLR